MQKMKWLLLSLTVLMVFSSCKKDNPDGSNQPTDIAFLRVGNKWVYNITGGFTSYSTTTNELISVNNGTYKMATWFDDTQGASVYLYGQGGYLCWYDEGLSKGANQQLYKYQNAVVGDTWTRITPTETYHHECLSVNESVTVPAGTFICKKIKVTFENSFNDQTTYWNDTYGQIKVDNLLFSTELASKNF